MSWKFLGKVDFLILQMVLAKYVCQKERQFREDIPDNLDCFRNS